MAKKLSVKMDKVDLKLVEETLAAVKVTVATEAKPEEKVNALLAYYNKHTPKGDLGSCDVCGALSDMNLDKCPFCGKGEDVSGDALPELSADEETAEESETVEEATAEIVSTSDDEDEESEEDGESDKGEESTAKVAEKKKRGRPSKPKTEIVKVEPLPEGVTVQALDEKIGEVNALKGDTAASFHALGTKIREIYEGLFYKARRKEDGSETYKNFNLFVVAELKMSPTQAYKLMDVSRAFTEAEVRQFGTSKLGLVLEAPEEARPKLLELAKTSGKRELQEEVIKEKNKAKEEGKEVTKGDRKKKGTPKGKGRAAEHITVSAILGKEVVHFFKQGKKGDSPIIAKTLEDVPTGFLDLQNGVRMYFKLGTSAQGGIVMHVNTKRVDDLDSTLPVSSRNKSLPAPGGFFRFYCIIPTITRVIVMQLVNAILDGNTIYGLYRNAEGKLCRKGVPPEYVCYALLEQITPLVRTQLTRSPYVKSIREEGKYLRICWADHEARRTACEPKGYFASLDIEVFEGDVHPVRRLLSDHETLEIAKPRRAYLDIETDSRVAFARKEEMRVLCWALVSDATGEVSTGLLEADTDEAERALLTAFWKKAEEFDQLVAWNGDRFDFPLMQSRSVKQGVGVKDFRRWLYLDHLLLFKRQNLNSAESGDEKQSFKLQDIAMSILKEGKDDFDARYTWREWEAGGERRERLLKYNVKDTVLLRKLEEKTGYIALFQSLCEVCRCFPETRSLNPTVQMDGYMLRLGVEKNYKFPTRHYDDQPQDKYKGAFVLDPTAKGIAKNVHVGDFKSLYPSIIVTWNMSPETKGPRIYTSKGDRTPEGYCMVPSTGLTFSLDPNAILPIAIKNLLRLRAEWADKKAALPPGTPESKEADRRSTAYKVAANSFYGVMGSPYSRYHDRDIAEAITQTGAYLIRQTMAHAETKGMQPIYGDTDSVFIMGVSEEDFKRFVKECNASLYPEIAKGCITNLIQLAYEKEFERVVFTSAKRYAGRFLHYKGTRAKEDSEPEIKGLEYKRGDSPILARRLQKRVIDLLLKQRLETPEPFLALMEKTRNWLLETSLPVEHVQVSKSLSKPLEEYATKEKKDGTQGADIVHVGIAKILKERGEDIAEGSRVSYVVVDATATPLKAIPALDYKGDFDRYYLWEKLIYPPSMRLLCAAFPEEVIRFEELSKARPRKPKGRPAPVEQLALAGVGDVKPPGPLSLPLRAPFEASTAPSPPPAPNGAINANSAIVAMVPSLRRKNQGPYVVNLPEGVTRHMVSDLNTLLSRHPGHRAVEVKIPTKDGEASLTLPHKVSVTPALIAAIQTLTTTRVIEHGTAHTD